MTEPHADHPRSPSPSDAADPWTTRRLLAWITDRFRAAGIDEHQLCAELLVCHVLGCERMRLYLDADRPAAPLEREALRDLVRRALAHEPVQYLTGEAWFFGLRLHVDQRVLIPRDATETIVEHVIQHCRREPGFGGPEGAGLLIADVGTGSGAMAVALAKNLCGARLLATDIDAGALEVARLNAERHGVLERVELLEGDLLAPLAEHPAVRGGHLDLIVSNPPYIPDDEWDRVAPRVREHEPEHALRGGGDGLDIVRRLLGEAGEPGVWALLRPGGVALIETAASRARVAAEIARRHPECAGAEVLDDLEGHPRVMVAVRAGER